MIKSISSGESSFQIYGTESLTWEDIKKYIVSIDMKLNTLIEQQAKMQEDIDYIRRYGYRM